MKYLIRHILKENSNNNVFSLIVDRMKSGRISPPFFKKFEYMELSNQEIESVIKGFFGKDSQIEGKNVFNSNNNLTYYESWDSTKWELILYNKFNKIIYREDYRGRKEIREYNENGSGDVKLWSNDSPNRIQESIRRILREEFNNLLNRLKPYLIEGKYLYHYTPTYNLDDIKEEGLIPRKTPNSFYKDGIEGIFLTNKSSLYSANLPQNLMNLMDEYYENGEEDEKPIVRLTIDVTQLNPDKITWDDDYIMNQYKWNNANTDEDKIIESIDIWGTISYKGLIPPELIINEDFDYLS